MAKRKNAIRDDGLIAVQIYLGRDAESGKRRYRTVYGKTQKEADDKALQIKLSMKKGIDISAERDTFSTWADMWLKVKAGEVSAGRLVVYESHVKHV